MFLKIVHLKFVYKYQHIFKYLIRKIKSLLVTVGDLIEQVGGKIIWIPID